MKKYLMGMIAIILAIGFSAFTKTPEKKVKPLDGEKWFVFDGVDPTDLNTASKYSMDDDGSEPTVCTATNDTYRCEILAQPQTGNTSLPNLSTIIDQTKRHTP